MTARTAFEMYLEQHPEARHVGASQPVVYFNPNSEQPGLSDFTPHTVPADAPDPDGFKDFQVPGNGFLAPREVINRPSQLPEGGTTEAETVPPEMPPTPPE